MNVYLSEINDDYTEKGLPEEDRHIFLNKSLQVINAVQKLGYTITYTSMFQHWAYGMVANIDVEVRKDEDINFYINKSKIECSWEDVSAKNSEDAEEMVRNIVKELRNSNVPIIE